MAEQIRKMEEVNQFILNQPEDIRNVTAALREIILNSLPELKKKFKWSMPN